MEYICAASRYDSMPSYWYYRVTFGDSAEEIITYRIFLQKTFDRGTDCTRSYDHPKRRIVVLHVHSSAYGEM